ncbi:GNAT family N-acetyltransferase [Halobacillus litoralis]|uniref:GNAT family N-acetyltransferase n=1 Tax=Halobacillus litoralis TaxID=45668 RepID=A0A845FFS8_9BACI|nr:MULTISPECIES: GNAT family N-acetyltransferase [Halobacillus]MBN9655386.1 GNAT family N-acetyltransferase [Halobacillus sp. GSS1]MEC3885022.1 GNAT family N-acetyltransferase [Halobacillus sp. HZG1]MYL72659.1 GNAT family N-acetyltransferase [Halobacillus litoralis]
MNHEKTYHYEAFDTEHGPVIVEGPLPSEDLEKYTFHEGLTAFRPPEKQFEAIKGIADFEEGRIIIARHNEEIIGYVTYLHPDPLERWSEGNMEDLIELGAIEVIPKFRGYRIGSRLLKVSMMDEYMENYIIISTEYYWHWDLKGTGLNIWDYRKVMEKMMAAGGLTPSPTDDPEIISHPANCLMVKIGNHVSDSSVEQFDKLRFLTRHQYRTRR